MSEPRRRLPPTLQERQNVVNDRMAAGSNRGATRWVKPVQRVEPDRAARTIEVVEHGDDSDVLRPVVDVVMWVGAATPSNALNYDFWYPANVTS